MRVGLLLGKRTQALDTYQEFEGEHDECSLYVECGSATEWRMKIRVAEFNGIPRIVRIETQDASCFSPVL